MAMGIWRKFQADICLSTTGFAGPDLGPNGEQPLAYFALVFRGQVVAEGAVSEILERNNFRKLVAERAGAALENWLLSGGTSPDK
jgi:nicotinamide mononucleotide (NMN) deamidase PncC